MGSFGTIDIIVVACYLVFVACLGIYQVVRIKSTGDFFAGGRRFNKFLVVVGAKAEQVLDVVNRQHRGILYVYQNPQLGTGHAAKIAAEALQDLEYSGKILVSTGDKLIEEEARCLTLWVSPSQ